MTPTRRSLRTAALFAVATAGCVTPPAPPKPRDATTVAAPMGKTWDAVIDAFAARNIPIHNMERVSGFIATDVLNVDRETGLASADCGTLMGVKRPAERATYNVLVRGDSLSATVRATVRWSTLPSVSGGGLGVQPAIECSSLGVWEKSFEDSVRARAERR
jgi:hypothetical protein